MHFGLSKLLQGRPSGCCPPTQDRPARDQIAEVGGKLAVSGLDESFTSCPFVRWIFVGYEWVRQNSLCKVLRGADILTPRRFHGKYDNDRVREHQAAMNRNPNLCELFSFFTAFEWILVAVLLLSPWGRLIATNVFPIATHTCSHATDNYGFG